MSIMSGRVVWIVLDGVGIGALPDASDYGDQDAATLGHVAEACDGLFLPNLESLGLGCLADIKGVAATQAPIGAYGRLAERSVGKDSIIGHWELAGVVVEEAFATYPNGFPDDLIDGFVRLTGVNPLGNVPASGTSILKTFGAEHLHSGRPILYTSVDSVLQIATHEDIYSPEELYALCRKVKPLTDQYNIARVIARPFLGNQERGFRRTSRRKDFPVVPPEKTLLEHLNEAGHPVCTVGKIDDLFAGRGITRSVSTENNVDGMQKIIDTLDDMQQGLLMANLIDFDMAYGHRQDALGFGRALEQFDAWLSQLFLALRAEDLLVICADHGCDPTTTGTDHSREYVPVLIWSKMLHSGVNLGDRQSFADLGATLADLFGVAVPGSGQSFLPMLDDLTGVSS